MTRLERVDLAPSSSHLAADFKQVNSLSQPLAVILPAFRARHLEAALESLARQTDQRFKLYVGDDCSPESLESIVAKFADRMSIEYRRFERNLGGSDLIAHWHRCIALSQEEPWIWVFSDDDLASPECVAAFLESVESGETATQLHRFQMDFIDDAGTVYFRPKPHPAFETIAELTMALLLDERRAWRAPDHVFSRRVYEETGGFVSLPKGIYSDYATWQKFAKRGGVKTIPDARVCWRHHRKGTSSGMREKHRREWHRAAQEYITWLLEFVAADQDLQRVVRKYGRDWCYRQHVVFWPRLSLEETDSLVKFLAKTFRISPVRARLEWYLALGSQRLGRKFATALQI